MCYIRLFRRFLQIKETVLRKVVSLKQSAFVEEWYITDNILVVHEILHSLKKAKGDGFEQRWSHSGVSGVARPLGGHGNKLRGPLELLVRTLGAVHQVVDEMSERRKGLAFHGHDESATSSNRGNYLELLQFLADNDDKVRKVVMESAMGNLKLAPCIQKEIVNSCALETLDAIMDSLSLSELQGQGYDGASKMRVILRLTNDLSQALQRKDQEIVNAMALVKSCKEKLHWMRNNRFDELVNEVSSFCEKHHIDVPNMEEAFILLGRSRILLQ
ncbi:hypothetical protein L3X38_032069 [Prunus dulcis]|uniref:DUF4371 domain-containing protein n=1 Tax=Prunus dulcis TaxID=3755 RepID=A0AAD4VFM3_PRUDU|nr:hypothetical protein L3X38_032069 [Prunus dulcis]